MSEEPESRGAGQRLGHPHADAAVRERERRRHDADDFHRHAVQRHRAADDRRIAGEPPRPQAVRQDRDLRTARSVFVGGEPAAELRRDLEHAVQRPCDARHGNPLRLPAPGQRHLAGLVRCDRRQRSRTFRVIEIQTRRHRLEPLRSDARHAMFELQHAIGIRERQRVEHDALDNGEDGDVRGDGERQRRDCCCREHRRPPAAAAQRGEALVPSRPSGPPFVHRSSSPVADSLACRPYAGGLHRRPTAAIRTTPPASRSTVRRYRASSEAPRIVEAALVASRPSRRRNRGAAEAAAGAAAIRRAAWSRLLGIEPALTRGPDERVEPPASAAAARRP